MNNHFLRNMDDIYKMRWTIDNCPYPIKFKERKPKIHPEIHNFNELPEDQKKILTEIKNYVKTIFPESRLFLFGSRIKGDWDGTSDYDILIECENDTEKKNIIKNHDFGVELDLFFVVKNNGTHNVEIL